MLIYEVRPPVADGVIVTAFRAGLTAAGWGSGLKVQRKLPSPLTRRMVTIRNDGGPAGRQSLRRYGVNVWADDSLDAEQIAGECSLIARRLPGTSPFVATSGFVDPVEIVDGGEAVGDDAAFAVGGVTLTHFYFPFRATLRSA